MAQELIGTSGLMNIPTADMQPGGTFNGGVRFLQKGVSHGLLGFDTGLYYVTFSPFEFVECTFRETLLKTQHNVRKTWGYYQQDRSSTIRIRPLKERDHSFLPSLVIGVNDIYSPYGDSFYTAAYGVLTKHVGLGQAGRIGLSAGYFRPFHAGKMYDGFFGGIEYQPVKKLPLCVTAEYDSRVFNIGASYTLFRRLRLLAFTREGKAWAFGLGYRATIPF